MTLQAVLWPLHVHAPEHTDMDIQTHRPHTHTVTTLLPILLWNGIHKLDLTFIEPFQNSDLFLMKFSLLVALAWFMKCLIKTYNYQQVQLATVVYKQNWFSTQGLQLQGQCDLQTGCVCWESSFSLCTCCHGHPPQAHVVTGESSKLGMLITPETAMQLAKKIICFTK